jgi:itaconyl-CoA hydratase
MPPRRNVADPGKLMSVTRNSYFESFKPGQKYVHRRGRTITQYDNLRWTFATMNTAQGHWNTEAIKDYFGGAFSEPIINGTIVIAVAAGLTSEDIAENCCAELELARITITTPVFPGDTLWSTSEILETADASSRPDAGLLKYAITARNQRDQVVCSFVRTMLVKRATHWLERDAAFDRKTSVPPTDPSPRIESS